MATRNIEKEKRRASNVLTAFNILFLTAAIAIIVKIVILQFFWEPDPKYVKYFQPKTKKEIIEPQRGSIIDHNGKLLAMSTPKYNVFMDCCILKDEFAKKKNGAELEAEWTAKSEKLAEELPTVLKERGRTANEYKELISTSRRKGKKYVPIIKGIDHATLLKLKGLTLFNEGRNSSGMIVEKEDSRMYPYGGLARRVIGYVKNNNDTTSYRVGIESKYDYVLHGKKGLEWKRQTDRKAMIQNVDSSLVAVEDGYDIRTTLDIDVQDIADRALRRHMENEERIVDGCVIILDVETGAVRAMANLRKKDGKISEEFNMGASWHSEPGSVFKAVTMTTLLEDGCIKLDTRIPTNHGRFTDIPRISADDYIVKYENRTGNNSISVLEGFEISSNYVFRRLAYDNYGKKPEEFISRLHEYNFGDAYEFELNEGRDYRPSVPDPESRSWTMSDLVSTAIGYSVKVSPLQVATFYNAIANNGKMMKPYVVESIEYNGKAVKEFKPTLLNGSICSKATADTLTRALKMVTLEGTASRLKNAKCTVAGKTGTSRVHLTPKERGGSGKPYETINGEKKHQATFVGFFPADDPQYTAIVVVYTGLMKGNVYGGSIPAAVFKDIVDELWAYGDEWGKELKSRGEVPQMRADHISTSKASDTPVPDVGGLGLRDALYAIENNGYRCSHSGTGHVVSQNPKAGEKMAKGQTVSIVLK